MKDLKLLILIAVLSFPGISLAQKGDVLRIINKNKEKLPLFIQFGIMSKNHEGFKKKYGIEVIYQNCVISKTIASQAKENNLATARALTRKYGNAWKKELGFVPYGL